MDHVRHLVNPDSGLLRRSRMLHRRYVHQEWSATARVVPPLAVRSGTATSCGSLYRLVPPVHGTTARNRWSRCSRSECGSRAYRSTVVPLSPIAPAYCPAATPRYPVMKRQRQGNWALDTSVRPEGLRQLDPTYRWRPSHRAVQRASIKHCSVLPLTAEDFSQPKWIWVQRYPALFCRSHSAQVDPSIAKQSMHAAN